MTLTKAERGKAAKMDVYFVWYQDNFSHDAAFVCGIFHTKAAAEEKVKERPLEANPSWDGYTLSGPGNLLKAYDDGTLDGAGMSADEWVRFALNSKK